MSTAVISPALESFALVPTRSEAGTALFCVLVKRTYDIRPGREAARSAVPRSLVQVDEYYDDGDPETATVKYETDLLPYKVASDVVLIGNAWAKGGKPALTQDVSLQIGDRKKTIRVIGDRRCVFRDKRPPSFSDPVPFTQMEIRYEHAYGGKDLKSIPDTEFHYPRNAMGTGLALRNVREVVDGLALPNLEDPADLLTPERVILEEPERWNRQPLPQGFGWFQRNWYPRCSFVAAIPPFAPLDEPMREEVLGLVPKNQIALARQFRLPSFDVRFNSGASPGLVLPFLKGGEIVKLTNLTPEGELTFTLPTEVPRMSLDIGFGEKELPPVLHTLSLRPEDKQLDLVWRGAYEYPGTDWPPQVRKAHVTVS